MPETKDSVLVRNIKLDDIDPCKSNPRRIDIKDAAVKSLSRSMNKSGQLVPVIVRPINNGRYELLAGSRRVTAARLLDWDAINAEIVEADDQRAMVIMTTENLQREDLTPFEEAESLKLLLDQNPDTKAVASNLGRSPQWVARRARLLELTPEWIEAGKDEFSAWSIGHFELIARYDPETQNEFLLKYQGTYCNDLKIDELERDLNEEMQIIKKAPWKPEDDTLIPETGACTACSKRSSCQSLLFEPEEINEDKIKAKDKCLDKSCWHKKLSAHVERQIARHKEKHPDIIIIRSDYRVNDDYRNALSPNDYDNVKKKDSDSVPAVVVSGPGAGEKRWIKLHETAPKRTARGKDEGGKPKPPSIKERLDKLQNRRNAWIVNKTCELLDEVNFKHGFFEIISLATVFGTKYRSDSFDYDDWKEYEKLMKLSNSGGDETINGLWHKISGVFISRLNYQTAEDATKRIPEVKRLCQLIYIDFDKLEEQAEFDVPMPKVLANQIAAEKKGPKAKKTKTETEPTPEKKKQVKRNMTEIAAELEIALQGLELKSGDRFKGTAAFISDRKIKVIYNPSGPDGSEMLTAIQAEKYLTWLKGDNHGRYSEMAG